MTDQDVETRLHELERRCRRLGALCLLTPSVVLAGCLAAALHPEDDVVRARRFVLVDDEGRTRGGMDCEGDEASFVLVSEGAGVALRAGGGEASVSLHQGTLSDAHLSVSQETAGLVLEAGTDPWGVVQLIAGAEGAGMGATWNDDTSVDVIASPDDVRLQMTTDWYAMVADWEEHPEDGEPYPLELVVRDGTGAIHLRNAEGETTFDAP